MPADPFFALDGNKEFVRILPALSSPGRRYRLTVSDNAITNVANLRALAAWLTTYVGEQCPSGYAIAFNAGTYTLGTDANAVRVNVTGAQVGATYAITISSSGGGTPVTATGTVSNASFNVQNINCSGLTAGTLTASIVLTDTDGEAGAAATGTGTLAAGS